MILQQHRSDDNDAGMPDWDEAHSSSNGDHAMWDVTPLLGTQGSLPQVWHPRYQFTILWSKKTLVFVDQQSPLIRRDRCYIFCKTKQFFLLNNGLPSPAGPNATGHRPFDASESFLACKSGGVQWNECYKLSLQGAFEENRPIFSYPVTKGLYKQLCVDFRIMLISRV